MMYVEEIREYLPQRYPFLFVDRVLDVNLEDRCIECYKSVSGNEDFFNGHFPGHPVMPGVLIVEAMAQAAGILGFCIGGGKRNEDEVYYFAGANNVRFKRPVIPGDTLILKAHFRVEKRGIWKFDCSAWVDGKMASQAEITCAKKEL
jgi:3-hydroxyacyl-[acyl-carrier-protein] dehydratase